MVSDRSARVVARGQRDFACTLVGQGVFGITLGRVWREVEGDLVVLPAVRASDGFVFISEDVD
jgi:hypothetical protein